MAGLPQNSWLCGTKNDEVGRFHNQSNYIRQSRKWWQRPGWNLGVSCRTWGNFRWVYTSCISFRNLVCNFILLALPRRGCLLSPQSVGVLPSAMGGELTWRISGSPKNGGSDESVDEWNDQMWLRPNPFGTWLIPGSGSTEFLAGSFSARPLECHHWYLALKF